MTVKLEKRCLSVTEVKYNCHGRSPCCACKKSNRAYFYSHKRKPDALNQLHRNSIQCAGASDRPGIYVVFGNITALFFCSLLINLAV